MSLRAIAARLNDRGIPCARHRDLVRDAGHAHTGATVVVAASAADMEAAMVVKFRLPDGSVLHEPPYTQGEIDDFYRRVTNGPIAVYRGDAAKSRKLPAPARSPSSEDSSTPEEAKDDCD
jgi:hypothetical protein